MDRVKGLISMQRRRKTFPFPHSPGYNRYHLWTRNNDKSIISSAGTYKKKVASFRDKKKIKTKRERKKKRKKNDKRITRSLASCNQLLIINRGRSRLSVPSTTSVSPPIRCVRMNICALFLFPPSPPLLLFAPPHLLRDQIVIGIILFTG
jgi:hypothetical protein